MAEERLRRNLDGAFDAGSDFPDPLLVSRAMAAIGAGDRTRSQRRPTVQTGKGVVERRKAARRLLAAALIVLVVIAAAGAIVALQHYLVSPVPAGWRACGGSFQCADVSVPLDYAHAGSGSISIATARKPATNPSQRVGALVLDVGPFGISGTDFLRRNSAFYDRLNARFDLVAIDRRGTGRSSAVRCLTGAQTDAVNQVDTVLDDAAEKQLYVNTARAFADICRQTSSRLLPFVDTGSAARDLDAVRKALGESKLTILAFGYGTFLGETYAHMYPSHLRGLVLDGVYDPAVGATDSWLQRAAGFESNLQAFLADCRAFAGCELAQGGDPAARLNALLQRVDQAPMPVGSRLLGRTLTISALVLGLDPQNWRRLDSALNDAAGGDGKALLALADEYYGRQPDGSYTGNVDAASAITCIDQPAPPDIAAYDRLGPAMAAASPIFGPAFQYVALGCAYWPAQSRRIPQALAVTGAPPTLLVAATHDPTWAYAWAADVNRQLGGSVLLTRDGYGALSYFRSGCITTAVDDYILRLTLPPPGTVCASDYPA